MRKRVSPPFSDIAGTVILILLSLVTVIALILPMAVIVIVSFDTGPMLRFPPQDFSFQRYLDILDLPGFLDAVRLSVSVASIVVAIDLLLGIPTNTSRVCILCSYRISGG